VDRSNLDAVAFLAWSLATDPDPALRNGAEAFRLASACVEATDRQEPFYLSTLAAACAENGQFMLAIRTDQEALALPLAGVQPELTASLEDDMAHYRAGQAIHASAETSGDNSGNGEQR
jgi:hypothetical protein